MTEKELVQKVALLLSETMVLLEDYDPDSFIADALYVQAEAAYIEAEDWLGDNDEH